MPYSKRPYSEGYYNYYNYYQPKSYQNEYRTKMKKKVPQNPKPSSSKSPDPSQDTSNSHKIDSISFKRRSLDKALSENETEGNSESLIENPDKITNKKDSEILLDEEEEGEVEVTKDSELLESFQKWQEQILEDQTTMHKRILQQFQQLRKSMIQEIERKYKEKVKNTKFSNKMNMQLVQESRDALKIILEKKESNEEEKETEALKNTIKILKKDKLTYLELHEINQQKLDNAHDQHMDLMKKYGESEENLAKVRKENDDLREEKRSIQKSLEISLQNEERLKKSVKGLQVKSSTNSDLKIKNEAEKVKLSKKIEEKDKELNKLKENMGKSEQECTELLKNWRNEKRQNDVNNKDIAELKSKIYNLETELELKEEKLGWYRKSVNIRLDEDEEKAIESSERIASENDIVRFKPIIMENNEKVQEDEPVTLINNGIPEDKELKRENSSPDSASWEKANNNKSRIFKGKINKARKSSPRNRRYIKKHDKQIEENTNSFTSEGQTTQKKILGEEENIDKLDENSESKEDSVEEINSTCTTPCGAEDLIDSCPGSPAEEIDQTLNDSEKEEAYQEEMRIEDIPSSICENESQILYTFPGESEEPADSKEATQNMDTDEVDPCPSMSTCPSSEIKSSMTTNDSGHRAMETEMDQQIPSMEMPPTSSYGMMMTSQYQPYDIAGYSLNQLDQLEEMVRRERERHRKQSQGVHSAMDTDDADLRMLASQEVDLADIMPSNLGQD